MGGNAPLLDRPPIADPDEYRDQLDRWGDYGRGSRKGGFATMARPKKLADERREHRHNLRFTLAEKLHIESQAMAAGLDVAEYLRRRAVGYTVPPAPSRRGHDPALISELNRIGVNVNQLARAVHRGSDFTRHWQEISRQLTGTLEKVLLNDGA